MVRRVSKERAQYWRGVIRDQKASGLSISTFCRERKVPAASFYSWRRKLANRQLPVELEDAAAKFVALDSADLHSASGHNLDHRRATDLLEIPAT